MKKLFETYLPILPLVVLCLIVIQFSTMWTFAGWFHYESQYSILPKESYLAELVTAEDYAKLQNRSLQEVKLSNGSIIYDRQPVWYERVLPNYKKVGDNHYICVTTVGTAHIFGRLFRDTLPLMLWALFGVFVSQWDLRRRFAKTSG